MDDVRAERIMGKFSLCFVLFAASVLCRRGGTFGFVSSALKAYLYSGECGGHHMAFALDSQRCERCYFLLRVLVPVNKDDRHNISCYTRFTLCKTSYDAGFTTFSRSFLPTFSFQPSIFNFQLSACNIKLPATKLQLSTPNPHL